MDARRRYLLASCMLLIAGCTGGMTDDFGDPVDCKRTQSFELDAQTPLGFSGDHMLGWVEGRHRFPFHWSDPCGAEDSCVRSEQCDALDARDVPSVAGTETFMTVQVHARNAQAIAELPDETQDLCARNLRVPVWVQIESEDGAFALEFEADAWAGDKTYTEIHSDALSQATGSLLDELPDGASLELGFGGGGDDYWYFDMYITTGRSAPALLRGAVAGSCVGEGPRSQYEQR